MNLIQICFFRYKALELYHNANGYFHYDLHKVHELNA